MSVRNKAVSARIVVTQFQKGIGVVMNKVKWFACAVLLSFAVDDPSGSVVYLLVEKRSQV